MVDHGVEANGRSLGWTARRVVRGVAKYGPIAIIDAFAVAATYMLAVLFRVGGNPDALLLDNPGLVVVVAYGAGCVQVLSNVLFDVYWRDWSAASVEDVAAVFKATAFVTLGLFVVNLVSNERVIPSAAILAGGPLVFVVELIIKLRPRWREILRAAFGRPRAVPRVIVVGAGRLGQLFASDIARGGRDYQIACFVDENPRKFGTYIHGIRVSGTVDELPGLVQAYRPAAIVIAIAQASGALIRRVVHATEGFDVTVRRVSGFSLAQPATSPLREIGIDELLARESVQLDTPEAQSLLRAKTVLVTGAAGSIGSELCRQVLRFAPTRLLMLDMSETGLYELNSTLTSESSTEILLGDIKDERWLRHTFQSVRPDVVFHAAAYKHVPILERMPLAGIATNVLGTANVLEASVAADVSRFVFISTDKAVEPHNILGYTKRFGELLTLAYAQGDAGSYAAVRFGNVLGSSGSAVPTFAQQIERGGPVTVTHPDATRYFMTVQEAAGLVLEAGTISDAGDLLVLDMGAPANVLALAKKMIGLRGLRTPGDIRIELVGLRPGEKLHESLTYAHEICETTRHPRVWRVVSRLSSAVRPHMQLVLREITAYVNAQDTEGAIQLVRTTVDRANASLSRAEVAETGQITHMPASGG